MADALRRFVRYPLEAACVLLAYAAFWALPMDAASAMGGWLARTLGPLLPVTRRAKRNVARAMPELAAREVDRTVRGMWDNLGRVFAEFPYIRRIARDPDRVEIVGAEIFELLRGDRRAAILLTGHVGNWEILPHVVRAHGVAPAQIYRAPNNPVVARGLRHVRRVPAEMQLPKGAAGGRGAVEALRAGRGVLMLVDQKMNDGIAVPFFGRDAMTSAGAARLGLRFECPIVPIRTERLAGCRFRVTLHPPIDLPSTGDRAADVLSVMTAANALLEQWIRARPGQWLWLHRRWPD